MARVIFRIDTRWEATSERGSMVHAVRNHFSSGTSFTRLCTEIMFSVLRVFFVAIQTHNRAEIEAAIHISKVQIDNYYQMALGLAHPIDVGVAAPIPPASNDATGILSADPNDLEGILLTEDSEEEFDEFETILTDD
ncbi:MAG: hypothetical protein HC851_21980 [Acaryochloris sp. RU_4_1]|nr:hypothetical protein [Acaryochloris sp. RU_4_1]NJR55645.1 hypothetical protein [Acaryochloris sp. CRU_2_0]